MKSESQGSASPQAMEAARKIEQTAFLYAMASEACSGNPVLDIIGLNLPQVTEIIQSAINEALEQAAHLSDAMDDQQIGRAIRVLKREAT